MALAQRAFRVGDRVKVMLTSDDRAFDNRIATVTNAINPRSIELKFDLPVEYAGRTDRIWTAGKDILELVRREEFLND